MMICAECDCIALEYGALDDYERGVALLRALLATHDGNPPPREHWWAILGGVDCMDALRAFLAALGESRTDGVPVRCKDCDVPNGCPEFCRCASGVSVVDGQTFPAAR